MNFFYYESKFKLKEKIFFGGRGEGGGGARVSDFFYTKNPNLKKNKASRAIQSLALYYSSY